MEKYYVWHLLLSLPLSGCSSPKPFDLKTNLPGFKEVAKLIYSPSNWNWTQDPNLNTCRFDLIKETDEALRKALAKLPKLNYIDLFRDSTLIFIGHTAIFLLDWQTGNLEQGRMLGNEILQMKVRANAELGERMKNDVQQLMENLL